MKRTWLLVLLVPIFGFSQSKNDANVQFVNPSSLPTPHGYTHIVVTKSKLAYISGQVALNSKGELVGSGDFRAQAKQAFENLQTALASVGARSDQIIKLNYYVVGLDHNKVLALREVRDQYIDKEHPPASTLLGVQALFREDCLIEIDAIVALN